MENSFKIQGGLYFWRDTSNFAFVGGKKHKRNAIFVKKIKKNPEAILELEILRFW